MHVIVYLAFIKINKTNSWWRLFVLLDASGRDEGVESGEFYKFSVTSRGDARREG
jgi:hypothetical protein